MTHIRLQKYHNLPNPNKEQMLEENYITEFDIFSGLPIIKIHIIYEDIQTINCMNQLGTAFVVFQVTFLFHKLSFMTSQILTFMAFYWISQSWLLWVSSIKVNKTDLTFGGVLVKFPSTTPKGSLLLHQGMNLRIYTIASKSFYMVCILFIHQTESKQKC